MDTEDDPGEGPGEWVSINEASRRLRVDPKTVGDWLAAVPPKLRERSRGNRGREVWVPEDERRDLPDHSGASPELVALQVQVARLEERLAAGERRENELRTAFARERTTLEERIADMAGSLVAERGRVDGLAAELAEARKPALLRLLEALRRRQ